jgi:hypothetical protein
MSGPNWNKEFARLLPLVANPPSDEATALGCMLREWLQNCVANPGTSIDTGGGFGSYDLWVHMGDEEIYIRLQSKPKATNTSETP